jgi:hypothetical protein
MFSMAGISRDQFWLPQRNFRGAGGLSRVPVPIESIRPWTVGIQRREPLEAGSRRSFYLAAPLAPNSAMIDLTKLA